MDERNVGVVVEHRDRGEHIVEECRTALPVLATSDRYANPELGQGDRGDGRLIVVGEQPVESTRRTFGVDQDAGVEEDEAQYRSSGTSCSRSSTRSFAHPGSTS